MDKIITKINDTIELLQNRRKLSLKGNKSSEYNYGRITAFNEAIAALKDLKKTILHHEKITISEDIQKKTTNDYEITTEYPENNPLQIV